MLPHVKAFNVCWSDDFTVHAGLQVIIATNDDPIQVHRNRKPTPLTTMIDSTIKRLASTLTGNDDQNHKESRKTIRARIHSAIDAHISTNAKLLHEYARNNDTHILWRCIARCIERGIIDITSQSDDEANRAKGHGKPKIRPTTLTKRSKAYYCMRPRWARRQQGVPSKPND